MFAIEEGLRPNGVVELSLVGELDMASAPKLEHRLDQLRVAGTQVVVDLSRVEFIDSSGLRVLLAAWSHGRETGWSFAIGPDLPPQAEHLFKLTGTDQMVGEDGIGS